MSNPLACRGSLHHVEIRVADLEKAIPSWGWAFHAEDRKDVDWFWNDASAYGWRLLYEDRYPWAGGKPGSDGAGHYSLSTLPTIAVCNGN